MFFSLPLVLIFKFIRSPRWRCSDRHKTDSLYSLFIINIISFYYEGFYFGISSLFLFFFSTTKKIQPKINIGYFVQFKRRCITDVNILYTIVNNAHTRLKQEKKYENKITITAKANYLGRFCRCISSFVSVFVSKIMM